MGILSRLLSLRATATLTIAATRGQKRGADTPPDAKALLLVLCWLLVWACGNRPAYADDEVYLESQRKIWSKAVFNLITNAFDSTTVDSTVIDNDYKFQTRGTYTNYYFQNWYNTINYGTNAPGDGSASSQLLTTNLASAPWVNGGLDEGTVRQLTLDLQHRWTNNVMVSNFVYQASDTHATTGNLTAGTVGALVGHLREIPTKATG